MAIASETPVYFGWAESNSGQRYERYGN